MREHMGLFRGKREDNGEWVEGSLVIANDCINNGKHYILNAASDFSFGDNGNRVRIGCFVEVDPETVGECTGLQDKNGKLIFEGDALRITDKYLKALDWTVEHRNYGFFVKHPLCDYWWSISELDGYTIEIIGTIHDKEVCDESKWSARS